VAKSTSHINLWFACVSFAIVASIFTPLVLLGRGRVTASEHGAAARSADGLIASALKPVVDPVAADGAPLPETARQQLDSVVSHLVDGDVTAIRVWLPTGVLLYGSVEAGFPTPPQGALNGLSSRKVSTPGGTSIFVTYSGNKAYLIELDQAAGPIDARIASEQRVVTAALAISGLVNFLLVQLVFRIIIQATVAENRRMMRLYIAGEQLRASLDLHDVLTQLARDATVTASGSHGLVALYEQETGDILLRVTYDLASQSIVHHQRAVEEFILRRSVITNTTIISGHPSHSYQQFFGQNFCADDQVNVLCVPMSLRDRVVGVIAVVRPPARRSAFAETDVREVVDLAVQGAMAIEQAELFAKVRSYADQVELSYDSTLKALMAALDAKDEVTEGHCERVAKLTVQLARQMGMPDDALPDIERGALLHDVGKIGVPDAVLKKPAQLNNLEWEAMRKHPLLAAVMISKVGFLESATPILLYHHERWDGTGYPFGLLGDKIPLEARLFSVIDAYDAMTSERPYRPAMTHEQAMQEIDEYAGTQFDPNVVGEFHRMMVQRPDLRARTPSRRDADAHDIDMLPGRPSEHAA
jgi:putative nucleotidyltransferase with HDIG domain